MDHTETQLDGGSIKVPDVVLTNFNKIAPVIAVEVGLTESLEELFNDARRLLEGSDRQTQLIILVKLYESGRTSNPDGRPWGIDPTELRGRMAKRSFARLFAKELINWYQEKNIRLVGDFTADMYFWAKERIHQPPKPIWHFEFGRNISEQSGKFSSNLQKSLLDREKNLKILGGTFPLPIKKLEDTLRTAIAKEELKRACHIITKAAKGMGIVFSDEHTGH
jgi:hypothetical protein